MNGEQRLFNVGRKFLIQGKVSSRALLFTLSLLVILTIATTQAPSLRSAHASNISWQQFVYNGPNGSRPYFVYTPENYQVGTAVPLIVMLHGCTQNAIDFANGTQMNQLADQYHYQYIRSGVQHTTVRYPKLVFTGCRFLADHAVA